jgi:predicted dehydrogenase
MPASSRSRRQFLKSTFPLLLSSAVLGRAGAVAPNSRIGLACIGLGGQGNHNLRAFLTDERVQVVAVCDVDATRRDAAAKIARLDPGNPHTDYRSVLRLDGIDAVMNATPDHWHAPISIAAAQAGKDLFSEKPLGAGIANGRALCDAVAAHQRVLQCGTWRRSGLKPRMACERVRNGYIGELKEIEVGVPGKFAIRGGFTGLEGPEEVPPGFDYQQWQGPVPDRPYTAARCHFNFRWINDYAPGYITDWGAHFLDVAQWGAGMDDTTPVEVQAMRVTRRAEGLYNAPEEYDIHYRYANGVKMRLITTTNAAQYGVKFIGTEGWIFTENETLQASSRDILLAKLKSSDTRLFESKNHHRNFVDAILSRGPTAAPAPTAQRAATACYLGSIAATLQRPLKFDPVTETFTGDAEANALLTPQQREGWKA